MTIEQEADNSRAPLRAALPWLVAAAALLVYILTLNHWVTLSSLAVVVRVGGLDWQPEVHEPLLFLLTLPIRWLPAGWQPLALNLLSAVCAALALALLARSVALLPHDRTREQRNREQSEFSLLSIRTAWLPPVLAAAVCGFQLTFWEHATVATGEMLNLLVFAYVIRCLLEYRVGFRDSWLLRMAFVYGLGVSNNWALIGFFPLFLIALIWMQGLRFFRLSQFLKLTLYGLGGMSLYLVLPVAAALSDDAGLTFWQALQRNLGSQKFMVFLPFSQIPILRLRLLVISLATLLPLLLIGVRWPSFSGDISALGGQATNVTFHVMSTAFLLLCLVVAFDPPFSPRNLAAMPGVPLLTFYYVAALCVGYFAGYLLLIFGESRKRPWMRPSAVQRLTSRVLVSLVWVLPPVMLLGLGLRNLPLIRAANGPSLRYYAQLTRQALPDKDAIVLSDDPVRLYLLETWLRRTKSSPAHILLDTTALASKAYHRHLQKRYGRRWPELPSFKTRPETIDDPTLLQLVADLASKQEVYYLEPSFGYYFERVYLQPLGLAYRLKTYPPNTLPAPALTPEEIQQNHDFWKKIQDAVLTPLERQVKGTDRNAVRKGLDALLRRIKIEPPPPAREVTLVAAYFSRALNHWGVELQKLNKLEPADRYFGLALDLNPENVTASVNRQFNQTLRTGVKQPTELDKNQETRFEQYRSWDAVLGRNGPFDEPNFCLVLGQVFSRNSLHRQAMQQLLRARELAPENPLPRFTLAEAYIYGRMPDKALDLIKELRADAAIDMSNLTNQVVLLRLEAMARFARDEAAAAERVLHNAVQQYPANEMVLVTVAQIYNQFRWYTNALATVEMQLRVNPNNPQTLLSKGALCIQMEAYEQAIPPLTRLLQLDPQNSSALINRAIAQLQLGRLAEARRDYEAAQKGLPRYSAIYYGLGEIAFRQKDRQAAVANYKLYLKYAPAGTDEARAIALRLEKIQSGSF